MSVKNTKYDSGLLPSYFKIIGIGMIILAFVPVGLLIVMKTEIEETYKEIYKILTMDLLILGLFFIAWAKDKIEDEMTVYVRLKSMAFAFGWAGLYVIIKPLIDLIINQSIGDLSGQQLVITMLFVYLVLYFFKKRSR